MNISKNKLIYSLNPNFIEVDYNIDDLIQKVDKLNHKYEKLQNLYYAVYIESFTELEFLGLNASNYLKLYNNFKEVCRLLNRIKNLIQNYGLIKRHATPMLGVSEIKLLLAYPDIKNFLDKFDLYPIVDSNYY
ncbi:hypothetical protein IIV22_009R [Invertebrate iridescent virus 22]|uniref:Uncharacterized protein n=1 Tax=Invertebrate iridescent virus 22 TaxID=345198 RepID=S6DAT6_9VIRU|nr:hypothetical protein IIV22_009R [Invertebrate iridescent virus 22]CCV01686.1 hypothetical protein IIV22_009R [Invertebrate iridescent virus 22]